MESLNTGCCVDVTGGVANERVHARGGVTEAVVLLPSANEPLTVCRHQ